MMAQFKLGADAETGEVSPLRSDYFADHDPIRVWRRSDGTMMVISGRHRLAHAKRAGVDRISAYVYDESNVYNEAWARRLDIELNIRDNQATALEVAMYVRGEFAEDKQPLTDAQVTAAGIAREGKIGSIGYRIGRNACESVMDALRNKVIEDTDALAIADFCPGNESVQGKGLKVILDGGSKTEARARMEAELAKQKMAREVGVEGGTDLFGNTLEDEAFWDFVAKYVVGRRNELAKDALFLRTNVGKRNSSAMTKKYGVDLKDPESLKKALKEIDMLRERWKNPYVEADLMEEIKQAWQERQEGEVKPAAQVFERYAQRLRERERGVTDYSVSPTLKEDLHEAFENRYGEDKDLPLCDSPRLFRVLGIVPAPIVTRQRIVRKLRLAHKLSEEQIAEAVLRFDDPLGVIVENRNAVIVLPGMLARNKAGKDSDMMSAIRLQRAKNGEHFMASLYPLDNLQKIEDQLRQGNLRYCKYNAKALANVSSNASGGTMTPALVRLLIHQGFNENTIIGSGNVKGENSISVTQAQERGMFKDGVMEVSNGVIVAPDTDYSVDFSHASYELFRKPDKKHVGKGEGVQVFGWACIYGAESWDTNKFYHGNFTQKVRGGFSLNGKVVSERAVLKQLNKETGKEYLLKFLNGAFRGNADEYRQLIEENRGWIEEDKKRLAEAERGYIDGKKRSEAEIKEEKAHLENAIKNRTSKLEAYEWLAKNEVHKVEDSVRYPVNYLMRADVDDSNLLHWDVPEFVGRELDSPDFGGAYYGREMVEKILGLDMKEPTEDLVRALWERMNQPDVPEEGYVAFKDSVDVEPIEYEFSSKDFDAADYDMETLQYWGEYIANVCMTGKEVYNALVRSLGSPRAASEWLDEHGVRGVKYYDGNTRHKEGEKVHNYAIFNPDYIEVIAINNRHPWSEYSADNADWESPEEVFGEDGEISANVIGEGAVTWERYKKRAFAGRDDGKMRAEIDASKARIKKRGWAKYKEAEYEEKDFCKLGELLSYPELYAAYPWMREVPVDKQPKGKRGSTAVMPPLDRDKTGRIRLGEKETEEEARRSLLHEVQHLIQRVEHFASGAGSNDMVREIMRELGREGEYQDTNDDFVYVEGKGYVYNTQGELYMRSAGEIEARNVAQRAGMSARERREMGFNETLDRRAEEAIVYDVNDYYYSYRWNALRYHAQNERSGASPDVSAAMRRAREMELTRRVHELLLGRREEREAKAMVEAWDDWMGRFKAVMAGKEGERSRLGRGMEAMGRMVALLESTRAALPGRYRVGWLDVQLRWATWYAQMMESGEVTLSEELKDDKRYAAWAARFRDEVVRKEEFGVSEQGLKEFLADMVGKRMDTVLENVAAKCRRTLERFLKDRARERMDDMAKRLYPKRERGKAWPRGKADAETYRFVQEAYKHMDAKPGEKGESGDYEAETERLERLLEEETDEGKRAELSKEVMMRRMFGEWKKMSYEQALAAEEYFTERVMSGRDAWAEKQQARREKIAYMKAKVRETKGWKGYGEEATINAQVEETAAKGAGLKNVLNFPFYAFTSFTGKMMGWRKELGGWFAERMSRKWAQMNVGIKGRTDELHEWFMQAAGTVSGRKTAEGIAEFSIHT